MGASESKGWDSWGDPTDVFACCGAAEHHAPVVVPQPGAVDSVFTGVGNSLMTGHTQQQAVQKAFVLVGSLLLPRPRHSSLPSMILSPPWHVKTPSNTKYPWSERNLGSGDS
jgi:hypothetical protein